MGFDPLRLSRAVEQEVTRPGPGGLERRYWRFRSSRHYGGNNAGDVVGCNLRCAFCWAWRYAHATRVGKFYTPAEASRRIAGAGPYRLARLTGGEPTIGWEHTRSVIQRLTRLGYRFILETNGILIGSGDVPAREVPPEAYVRVSVKAPDPESFERATGASGEGLQLQKRAIEDLASTREPGAGFHVAIVVGVAPRESYARFIEWLASVDRRLVETLEPEYIVLYPHVKKLMNARGFRPYFAIEP